MSNTEWETPTDLVQRCAQLCGLEVFSLDVAATSNNCKGMTFISAEKDGLNVRWDLIYGGPQSSGYLPMTSVWCNPPYKNIINWVTKAIEESQNVVVCMLLPNDTDTKWFHLLLNRAEIYVTKGRVKFRDPTGKGRVQPRQGHIVAVLRPPVEGVTRPTGIVGTIDAS